MSHWQNSLISVWFFPLYSFSGFGIGWYLLTMGSKEDDVKKAQIVDARARNISHNVRCTECGSQSIEDSQADIAILLRKVLYQALWSTALCKWFIFLVLVSAINLWNIPIEASFFIFISCFNFWKINQHAVWELMSGLHSSDIQEVWGIK